MKFPRRAKLLSRPPDATPLAGVFFLLLFFLLLMSPGVAVNLPIADSAARSLGPAVAVAVDAGGHLYFNNQRITADALREELRRRGTNITVVLQADRTLSYERITEIAGLVRGSGGRQILLATRPGLFGN
jgi:biopolymer transport protein ExbD